MVEGIRDEDLKNGDKFDFYEAIDSYGFDFDTFSEKNFESFVQSIVITDFTAFRRNYLMRDFFQVRFYAHKFKGVFKLMLSKDINENCEKLQFEIQTASYGALSFDEYEKFLESCCMAKESVIFLKKSMMVL